MVDLGRNVQSLLDNQEAQEEDDRVANFAGEARWGIFEHPIACEAPKFGVDVEVDERDILDLTPETRYDFEGSFGATIGLRFGEIVSGDFLGEDGGRRSFAENAILAKGEEGLE